MAIKLDALTGTADYRNPETVAEISRYSEAALQNGDLGIVFADVVGLGEINSNQGTLFADQLLRNVGSSLGFEPQAYEDIQAYVETARARTRSSIGQRKGVILPDLWIRKGGDEMVGLIPVRAALDSSEIVDRALTRVETSLSACLKEDTDARFGSLGHFPLRFGYNIFPQGSETMSAADLIRYADAAANIAKLIGFCRKPVAAEGEAYRVKYEDTDEVNYEGMDIVRTKGNIRTSVVTSDTSRIAAEASGHLTAIEFTNTSVLGSLVGALRIENLSGEEKIYLGAKYRMPLSGQWAAKPDWFPLENYDARYLRQISQIDAPSISTVSGMIRELEQ